MPADLKPIKVEEKLPPANKWVFAITATYRCMGYVDDRGTWKDVNRHEVIEGVEAWCPAEPEGTAIPGSNE